ncbi:glycoside hydrolase superfamily [Hypomontagnella submonticulosa]|nr:glycoside hydrolase superfamily [Hypomontagnella submonticulosa]
MKPTVAITLLSLLHLSAGQPRHNHGHRHNVNRASIPKRDKITISDSARSAITELPEVVVYVDQYNNPVRTTTEMVVYVPASVEIQEVPTSSTSLAPSTSSSTTVEVPPSATMAQSVGEPVLPTPPPPVSTPTESSLTTQLTPPAQSYPTSSTSASSKPSPSSSLPPPPPPATDGKALHGVTYSPYKGKGGCKSAAEVENDFALIAKDYGVIRLYGVDCDQVATAYAAAKKHGNKLFLGIFDINSVDQAVSTIAAGVKNDWSIVDTVSVGNELVNNGGATVDQSLAALNQARSALRAAGYKGPVVIVDTFVAMLAHPELCDQSDYCACNIHPFFDPNTDAQQAGSFVTSTVSNIRSKLSDPSKRIVVTETGWPWQGETNGAAVPGMDQQTAAISSIKSAYTKNARDVILFTAFNDMWKKPEAGTFMAEQYWGMGGRYSPCDS